MVKKMALLMTVFLMFDRFIQHKIDDGRKQRLALLQKKEHSLHKDGKRGKSFFTQVS